MHTIVYSLPASRGTGSLRYSNSIEPLRELEIVRIELVEDFIVEPMLAAKFPHPLYCILGAYGEGGDGTGRAPGAGKPPAAKGEGRVVSGQIGRASCRERV